MAFKNTITKIEYYFFMTSFQIFGIILLTSFFFLRGLNFDQSFKNFFFGCFFIQIGIGFLIVLLYYYFSKSKKDKIIHWIHIVSIGGVFSFFSVLPVEWFIFSLIRNDIRQPDLFLFIIGVFLLICFVYLYYDLKNDPNVFFTKEPKSITENETVISNKLAKIMEMEKNALNCKNRGNHEEALNIYQKALNMLLEYGFQDSNYTSKIKKQIRDLSFILNKK